MTERDVHVAVMDWATIKANQYAEFWLLHAIPNGGARDPRVAAMMTREGVKPGVPDIFWPVPTVMHSGIYLEFKHPNGGKFEQHQASFQEALAGCYFNVQVVRSVDHAIDLLAMHHEGFLAGMADTPDRLEGIRIAAGNSRLHAQIKREQRKAKRRATK